MKIKMKQIGKVYNIPGTNEATLQSGTSYEIRESLALALMSQGFNIRHLDQFYTGRIYYRDSKNRVVGRITAREVITRDSLGLEAFLENFDFEKQGVPQ